jgi:hypothetical protein
MAVQNLVSASLSFETTDEILGQLAGIRGRLDFLLNLQTDEAASILKAGKEFLPFIEACHGVAQSHPEILPGVFNKAEYDRDHQMSQRLGEIADALAQLNEAVSHTLTAVRSDDLVASLDVYSAVKANKSKVPGLNTVAESLARYFAKSPRATPAAAK